jgi:large subunit ribosomal protein L37Ae
MSDYMSKKRKVGSAGRYGTRYGKRIKSLVSDIEKIKRARHVCPKCKMKYVVRESVGIWKCKKCGAKFAGGSHRPKSE